MMIPVPLSWIAILVIFLFHKGYVSSAANVDIEEENDNEYEEVDSILNPSKSNRDFRRGVSILERLSQGAGRIAADSSAELSLLNAIGGKIPSNMNKASTYASRSAEMGSFKGAYIHAFLMAQSGSANESEIFRYLEMSSRNNHRPALTAIGFQKLFLHDDCPSALNHYRTSAVLAINQIDSTFFGDYASLQNLTMGPDSLGDDAATKAARDVETINYWNFQADRRDSRAFYELGKIYQLGLLGARRDMEKAAEYYQRAGLLGHKGALAELGRLLSIGHGRDVDYHIALQYLQQAADSNEPVAMATLGSLLIRQIYSSDDALTPLRNLRAAAALNNADADWELAQIELREGRLDAALQHLLRAERAGHIRSAMALAQLYEKGLGGLPQSCERAVRLYKRVSEVGPWLDGYYGPREAVREFRMGNEESALMMSLLGAFEGYEVAQFNAAWLLIRRGAGKHFSISRRYELAAQMLHWVSLQNPLNSAASILEGYLHMEGGGRGSVKWPSTTNGNNRRRGVNRNLTHSALCFERAAEAGSAEGMEQLALQLINGAGIRADHKRASQLMKRALSTISSGHAGYGGLRALSKQFVLRYRIAFLWVVDFLEGVFSGRFIRRVLESRRKKRERAHPSSKASNLRDDLPPSSVSNSVDINATTAAIHRPIEVVGGLRVTEDYGAKESDDKQGFPTRHGPGHGPGHGHSHSHSRPVNMHAGMRRGKGGARAEVGTAHRTTGAAAVKAATTTGAPNTNTAISNTGTVSEMGSNINQLRQDDALEEKLRWAIGGFGGLWDQDNLGHDHEREEVQLDPVELKANLFFLVDDSEEGGAGVRCLQVDGTLGGCDVTSIFTMVTKQSIRSGPPKYKGADFRHPLLTRAEGRLVAPFAGDASHLPNAPPEPVDRSAVHEPKSLICIAKPLKTKDYAARDAAAPLLLSAGRWDDGECGKYTLTILPTKASAPSTSVPDAGNDSFYQYLKLGIRPYVYMSTESRDKGDLICNASIVMDGARHAALEPCSVSSDDTGGAGADNNKKSGSDINNRQNHLSDNVTKFRYVPIESPSGIPGIMLQIRSPRRNSGTAQDINNGIVGCINGTHAVKCNRHDPNQRWQVHIINTQMPAVPEEGHSHSQSPGGKGKGRMILYRNSKMSEITLLQNFTTGHPAVPSSHGSKKPGNDSKSAWQWMWSRPTSASKSSISGNDATISSTNQSNVNSTSVSATATSENSTSSTSTAGHISFITDNSSTAVALTATVVGAGTGTQLMIGLMPLNLSAGHLVTTNGVTPSGSGDSYHGKTRGILLLHWSLEADHLLVANGEQLHKTLHGSTLTSTGIFSFFQRRQEQAGLRCLSMTSLLPQAGQGGSMPTNASNHSRDMLCDDELGMIVPSRGRGRDTKHHNSNVSASTVKQSEAVEGDLYGGNACIDDSGKQTGLHSHTRERHSRGSHAHMYKHTHSYSGSHANTHWLKGKDPQADPATAEASSNVPSATDKGKKENVDESVPTPTHRTIDAQGTIDTTTTSRNIDHSPTRTTTTDAAVVPVCWLTLAPCDDEAPVISLRI